MKNFKYYVDIVLIQCYSGWRPRELGLLKLENANLEAGTFIGGMKTSVGLNRLVPIHSKIRPLVEKRYKEAEAPGSEYLINYTNTSRNHLMFTYDKYQNNFVKIRDELNLNPKHRSHDGRIILSPLLKSTL